MVNTSIVNSDLFFGSYLSAVLIWYFLWIFMELSLKSNDVIF